MCHPSVTITPPNPLTYTIASGQIISSTAIVYSDANNCGLTPSFSYTFRGSTLPNFITASSDPVVFSVNTNDSTLIT